MGKMFTTKTQSTQSVIRDVAHRILNTENQSNTDPILCINNPFLVSSRIGSKTLLSIFVPSVPLWFNTNKYHRSYA